MDDHEWIVLDTKFKTAYTYGVGVIPKDFYNIMTFGDLKDFSGSNIEIYSKDFGAFKRVIGLPIYCSNRSMW